ncbi:MAG TPA: PrgI family protein [Candidatus Saccharimonadales bacterium]|nr:PrgI family protein [Candidatus Saccharimonadales bacterium]
MATYKVIQDVEAEDKLIGPLSPRQFLYAGICAVCMYLTYYTSAKGAGFLAVIFLPVIIVTGFFAFPWGRDQPTEIWALAKIRFLIKPRRRIWDQSGARQLVTITAPKHVQAIYTNGLSETEVHSRLRALADTIDSRGWAIKNSNINMDAQTPLTMAEPVSDRLVAPSTLPQTKDDANVSAADDILDEKNNATATRVDGLINAASSAHRKKIVESLKKEDVDGGFPDAMGPGGADKTGAPQGKAAGKPNNYWFLNQPNQSAVIPNDQVTFNTQVVTPHMADEQPAATRQSSLMTPEEEEARLVAELEARKATMPTTSYYGHLHTIKPLSEQQRDALQHAEQTTTPTAPPAPAPQQVTSGTPPTPTTGSFWNSSSNSHYPSQSASPGPMAPPLGSQTSTPSAPTAEAPPVTPEQQAAILQLSTRNDLNVATIAREAQRSGPQDEVVIKLH